jgi:hypothetical protein
LKYRQSHASASKPLGLVEGHFFRQSLGPGISLPNQNGFTLPRTIAAKE